MFTILIQPRSAPRCEPYPPLELRTLASGTYIIAQVGDKSTVIDPRDLAQALKALLPQG